MLRSNDPLDLVNLLNNATRELGTHCVFRSRHIGPNPAAREASRNELSIAPGRTHAKNFGVLAIPGLAEIGAKFRSTYNYASLAYNYASAFRSFRSRRLRAVSRYAVDDASDRSSEFPADFHKSLRVISDAGLHFVQLAT